MMDTQVYIRLVFGEEKGVFLLLVGFKKGTPPEKEW